MWEVKDQVVGVHLDTNTIRYTNDTWAGNSGLPTWTYDAIDDVVRQHAIHVSRQAQELRRGVLITNAVFQWIQTACQTPTPPNIGGFQLIGL